MAVISARLVWLGSYWGCKLPSYSIVYCTVRPTTVDKVDCNGVLPGVSPDDPATQDLWCDCDVPDEWVDESTGLLDPAAVADDHPDLDRVNPDSVGPATPIVEPLPVD